MVRRGHRHALSQLTPRRTEHVEGNVTQAALDAINATSLNDYPSLFSWTLHRDMPSDPGDNIFRPGGGPNCSADGGKHANFSGVWWDAGAAHTLGLFEDFFAEYARLGGKCERFVIDAEEWLNNWVLVGNPGPPPGCHQQRARAIAADARFPAAEQRLAAAGFYLPAGPARSANPDWLFDALTHNSSQYHIWNNVMLNQSASYFNTALWDPLRRHFPEAQLSNYDYMIYNGSASQCEESSQAGASPSCRGHEPALSPRCLLRCPFFTQVSLTRTATSTATPLCACAAP